jgi:lactoylglutathione lyase
MIRIKDHEKSLKFYQEVFGMTLMRTSENKDANFNLYFLGYPGEKGVPTASANGINPVADREGLLELTWNYGTEKDANFKYHNGNDQPQGFGHICILHSILLRDVSCTNILQVSQLTTSTQHASVSKT